MIVFIFVSVIFLWELHFLPVTIVTCCRLVKTYVTQNIIRAYNKTSPPNFSNILFAHQFIFSLAHNNFIRHFGWALVENCRLWSHSKKQFYRETYNKTHGFPMTCYLYVNRIHRTIESSAIWLFPLFILDSDYPKESKVEKTVNLTPASTAGPLAHHSMPYF